MPHLDESSSFPFRILICARVFPASQTRHQSADLQEHLICSLHRNAPSRRSIHSLSQQFGLLQQQLPQLELFLSAESPNLPSPLLPPTVRVYGANYAAVPTERRRCFCRIACREAVRALTCPSPLSTGRGCLSGLVRACWVGDCRGALRPAPRVIGPLG